MLTKIRRQSTVNLTLEYNLILKGQISEVNTSVRMNFWQSAVVKFNSSKILLFLLSNGGSWCDSRAILKYIDKGRDPHEKGIAEIYTDSQEHITSRVDLESLSDSASLLSFCHSCLCAAAYKACCAHGYVLRRYEKFGEQNPTINWTLRVVEHFLRECVLLLE